ncbi:1-aminocyclopropane-1-carboxylate oxidase [Solanum lycopersicum]|uniref:Non-haem dioxygenase N-terminal domain-containing protein n=1 Tax=Solanum lycopersicum TaxID=4081 RepID=A0A3Q7GS19_SOLLC|nr:gibberellin 2-beta-dioxygenase 3 [Solanum lycopersicum]
MASSTQEHHLHHLPTPYGTTTAPPPTPSAHSNHNLLSTSEAADSLSRLLHRIPPTLSLSFPGRRQSPPPTTVSPHLISLSDAKSILHSNLLFAAKQHGFFQLTQHSISSHLAQSAESESASIFNDEKQLCFPKNWPLGFDNDEDDDDDVVSGRSICLDESSSMELGFSSIHEFTSQMEKLGLELIEELACAVGFENPVREDRTRLCSLMWISDTESGSNNMPLSPGRIYPYVVGLNYQIRCRKYSMLADSSWVSVTPQVDSVMVTLGDIAQVWSNGKVKQVRGRPVPITNGEINSGSSNSHCLSMTLLVTLAHENTVSPLLRIKSLSLSEDDDGLGNNDSKTIAVEEESQMFNSFSFEDYAWRVYHERLILKDPLVRYRV